MSGPNTPVPRVGAGRALHALASWHTPAVLSLTLVATALRLHELGLDSVWLDEAHTFHRARLPLGELFDETVRKRHVPTYFVFMHFFQDWFGDGEWWLRVPSAVFGVLTVLAMYVAGCVLGGVSTGFVAGAATAMAPYHVAYAQEARMYTMVTFAAAVALAGFAWLVREPERAARPPWRTLAGPHGAGWQARCAWGAVVLGAAGALWLHNTAHLFVASLAVAALVAIALSPGHRRALLLNWLAAGAAVLVLYAAWLPFLLRQTSGLGDREWGPTEPAKIRVLCEQLYLFGRAHVLTLNGVVACCAAGVVAFARQRRVLVVMLVLTVLAPASILGVSAWVRPVFMARTALWTTLPLYLLLGMGWARVRPAWLTMLASSLLLYFPWSLGTWVAYSHWKVPNREIAKTLRDKYARGDTAIILSGLSSEALEYYFTRRDDPVGPIAYTLVPQRLPGRQAERTLRKAVGGARRVVFVDHRTRDGEAASDAIKWLEAHGTGHKQSFRRRVTLIEYTLHGKPR